MPRIVFFIGLLGLFLPVTMPVRAYAADSAYDIKDVQVDILDESAVKARNKAFIEAQRKAFLMLAARFEAPEALAALKPPADDVLSGMIQDFEISSEQLSTKRYRGIFEFRFKSSAVNHYFGHGPTNYESGTSAESQRILLLPYYQEGINPPLFDKTRNLYLSTLQAELPTDGSIILPEGSISDVTDIGDGDPHVLSSGTIRRLMARYDVQSVVVALAHVDIKNPQSVKIEIFRTDRGRIELMKSIDAVPKQIAAVTFQAVKHPTVEEVQPEIPATNAPEKLQSEINPEPFTPRSRPNVADLVREKKAQQLARLRQANPSYGQEYATPPEQNANGAIGETSIKVFFTNMSEWLAIQKQLSQVDGARNLRIVSLKTNQVDIVIGYSDWNMFTASLQSMGLTLEPQPDRTYILKRQSGHF